MVGGATLTTTTVTESPTGTMKWDADDLSWATSTITNARALFCYANALTAKNGIVLLNFGADYSTVAGTFTVQFATGGIFTVDWTP